MKRIIAVLAAVGFAMAGAIAHAAESRPTIVLVHGAFAESSSWNGVVKVLEADGYRVIAAANPLRSVKGDAEYVSRIVAGIKSPVVLVGHSYGGLVINQAANGNSNVKSLVFVSAFAPDVGENALGLSGKFPGSTLGPALDEPVALPGGGKDLYIRQDKFHNQFAADVSAGEAKLMAATQRPIAEAALAESASEAAWKQILFLVCVWRSGQEHPAAGAGVHGEARQLARDCRREGRFACRDGVQASSRREGHRDRGEVADSRANSQAALANSRGASSGRL